MNIAIIGPDGSGKTTIAKKLAEKLQYRYYKGSYIDANKLLKANALSRKSSNTVFDRFYYPDEMIYRKIKNDPLDFKTVQQFASLEPTMKANGFIYLYINASTVILRDRLLDRGDEFITPDDVSAIQGAYIEFIKNTTIPVMMFNTSYCDPDDMVSIILRELKKLYYLGDDIK